MVLHRCKSYINMSTKYNAYTVKPFIRATVKAGTQECGTEHGTERGTEVRCKVRRK